MGLIWIIIVIAVIYFLKESDQFNQSRQRNIGRDVSRNKNEAPFEIARKRYAQGEITKEEFQEIKKELKE